MELANIVIYTVMSLDTVQDEPVDPTVTGSWTDREEAINQCVDYIVERCYLRPDIRYALMHDENHPDMLEVVSAKSGAGKDLLKKSFAYNLNDGWEMPSKVEEAVKEYLASHLGIYMGYQIDTDIDSDIGSNGFMFVVSKNSLTFDRDTKVSA